MNTTVWTIIGSLLLVTYTISFMDYQKSRRGRERKQEIPFFTAFLIGPLLFFKMNTSQRRERRKFMAGKRRFS